MKNKRYIKRLAGIALIGICSVGLCSCASSIDYTEEQEDVIANYAAEIVLKHDVEYKYNYYDSVSNKKYEEETTFVVEEEHTTVSNPSTVPDGQEETKDNNNGNDNLGHSISDSSTIASAFELPTGVNADFVDYMVTKAYPTDASQDIFVMKAVANSKLLVLKFKITNTNQTDTDVNFMANEKKYRGIVDDSKKYNAQLTLLSDALNTYEGKVPANSSKELVLIYQTQIDSKEDIKSIAVSVSSNNGEGATVYLK